MEVFRIMRRCRDMAPCRLVTDDSEELSASIIKVKDVLDPEDEGSKLQLNVGNFWPIDMASYL
jgi:hypothetical protein